MKEALLYSKLDSLSVRCQLCSHQCLIQDGKSGFCGVRKNIGGSLYADNYAKLVAANADPVEKKPLYHFMPGSKAFSIASLGCNFRCGFCQNWQISQPDPYFRHPEEHVSAQQVIKSAKQHACGSIAYTYTEPTIYFEFALETAKLARQAGLYNIFVSNGYMSAEATEMIRPYLDAVNIDLKFFRDTSYQKICSGRLQPVLDSISSLKESGVWVEVTTLVIPGENDSLDELSGIAGFISSLSRDIPWHVSRFHADYKFKSYQDTPEHTIRMASDLGREAGLRYVYAGNVGSWGQNTVCPACAKVLIKREGFMVSRVNMKGNKCSYCHKELAGVFNPG